VWNHTLAMNLYPLTPLSFITAHKLNDLSLNSVWSCSPASSHTGKLA
jgi:hypothetical protein